MGLTAAALMGGGSLLGGVSSMVGGKKGASAAQSAAGLQAAAAMQAANLQQQRFQQTAQTLQPYIGYGESALPAIQALTGTGPGGNVLTAPLTSRVDISQAPTIPQIGTWSPTMQQLAQTPGYQFQLQQGLLAAQSGSAAQGLGRSGAAMKAAEQYAQGLASTTYQNQFSNWLQQQQLAQQGGQTQFNRWLQSQQLGLQGNAQIYNMLTGQAGAGLSAAGALGGVSIQNAGQIAQALQNAGAAQAGGITGAAQAQIGGMTGATSAISSPLTGIGTMMMANQLGLFGAGGQNFSGGQAGGGTYPGDWGA